MNEPRVYVVDDDAVLRDALTFLLSSRKVSMSAFASGEEFLGAFTPELRGCVLTDIRMDGISGLELFSRLKDAGSRLPCIVLTGHGDVPMAVEALKNGVRDFIEKPFDANDLVDKLIVAMADDLAQAEQDAQRRSHAERMAILSEREQEVMQLLVAGKPNKVIADDLAIAIRTVEVHRARIFEKLGVRSAVELVKLLASMDKIPG
ncbi:MAG: response regulator transcription factor [Hyphomicrobium sp.]|jgi:two-component system response regulator DctR